MLRKITLALIILALLITLVTCGMSFIEKKQSQPPDMEKARYRVQTWSRIYYAEEVGISAESFTLKNYWETQNGKWVYKSGNITLEKSVFGDIKVSLRTNKT